MTVEEKKERNRLRSAEYRKTYPERARAAVTACRKESPEKARAATIAWRKANPGKAYAAVAAYRKAHPEKKRAWDSKYRDIHYEKTKSAKTAWRKEHREKAYAATAAWSKAHPEEIRRYARNRRATITANGGKLSPGLEAKLLSFQKNRCAICRCSLKKTGHHLDHIVPLKRGGKNVDGNTQITCPKCNLEKGHKDSIVFMQERGYLL